MKHIIEGYDIQLLGGMVDELDDLIEQDGYDIECIEKALYYCDKINNNMDWIQFIDDMGFEDDQIPLIYHIMVTPLKVYINCVARNDVNMYLNDDIYSGIIKVKPNLKTRLYLVSFGLRKDNISCKYEVFFDFVNQDWMNYQNNLIENPWRLGGMLQSIVYETGCSGSRQTYYAAMNDDVYYFDHFIEHIRTKNNNENVPQFTISDVPIKTKKRRFNEINDDPNMNNIMNDTFIHDDIKEPPMKKAKKEEMDDKALIKSELNIKTPAKYEKKDINGFMVYDKNYFDIKIKPNFSDYYEDIKRLFCPEIMYSVIGVTRSGTQRKVEIGKSIPILMYNGLESLYFDSFKSDKELKCQYCDKKHSNNVVIKDKIEYLSTGIEVLNKYLINVGNNEFCRVPWINLNDLMDDDITIMENKLKINRIEINLDDFDENECMVIKRE